MSSNKNLSDDSDKSSRPSSEKHGLNVAVPAATLEESKLVTAKGNIITKDGAVISTAESDTSLSTNIFADPEIKAYYIGVYEKAKYECRHVFDAEAEWSKEEERKIIRKLDWRGMYTLHTASGHF